MIEVPNTPDEAVRILQALARFSTAPELHWMREWMKTELARLDTLNRRELAPETFRQRQGACQVLEKILVEAETADKKAEQIRINLKR